MLSTHTHRHTHKQHTHTNKKNKYSICEKISSLGLIQYSRQQSFPHSADFIFFSNQHVLISLTSNSLLDCFPPPIPLPPSHPPAHHTNRNSSYSNQPLRLLEGCWFSLSWPPSWACGPSRRRLWQSCHQQQHQRCGTPLQGTPCSSQSENNKLYMV